ncbi:MAG TPA: hypothetical protein EYO76_09850, partial [Flavobacteriaceae bacterium]|nr:hypothetical protein [Flavobacteriaceae bacterium]
MKSHTTEKNKSLISKKPIKSKIVQPEINKINKNQIQHNKIKLNQVEPLKLPNPKIKRGRNNRQQLSHTPTEVTITNIEGKTNTHFQHTKPRIKELLQKVAVILQNNIDQCYKPKTFSFSSKSTKNIFSDNPQILVKTLPENFTKNKINNYTIDTNITNVNKECS